MTIRLNEIHAIDHMTILGNNDPTDPATPSALTVAEVNAMGIGGASIPIVLTDPVTPTDGQMWLWREIISPEFTDGDYMGFGAFTYCDDVGTTNPLQLSVWDDVTSQIIRI